MAEGRRRDELPGLDVAIASVVKVDDEDRLTTISGAARQEGFAQGRQEGRRAGRVEKLLTGLESRFDPVPDGVESRVRAAAVEELDRWLVRAFVAGSLDEVMTDAPER